MPETITNVITDLLRLKYPSYPTQTPDEDKTIAGFFAVSAASYSNYKTGKRAPVKEQADKMAKSWMKHLEEVGVAADVLARRLEDQGYSGPLSGATAWINQRLVEAKPEAAGEALPAKRSLRLSALEYGVFATGKSIHGEAPGDQKFKPFFNQVYEERYLAQLGLNLVREQRSDLGLADLLRTRGTDLGTCYFAAASRADGVRFFPSPLRVSLGAVTTRRHELNVNRIAEWLCTPKSQMLVKPIVVRSEVGHLYCQHTLEQAGLRIESALDTELLKKALLEEDEENPAVPPVVVVDEYTALRLLAEMKNQALFVAPVTTTYTTRASLFRRELPLYFMSIACRRGDRDVEPLLEDTLSLFFTTEVETTARALASTYKELLGQVTAAAYYLGYWSVDPKSFREIYQHQGKMGPEDRAMIARQYCLFTLSLNRGVRPTESAYADYWSPILQRARRIVDEQLFSSGNPDEVVEQILRSQEEHRTRLHEKRALEEICRYFDHPFDLKNLRGHSASEIVAHAKAALLEESEAEDVSFEMVSPQDLADEKNWKIQAGLLELLHQLIGTYSRLLQGADTDAKLGQDRSGQRPKNDVVTDIQQDYKSKFRRYSRILYASASSATDYRTGNPAGMLFIMEQPGCRPGPAGTDEQDRNLAKEGAEWETLSKRCELRYLCVPRFYHGYNVSRVLIAHAIDWCRQQTDDEGQPLYSHVRVAILPGLSEAIRRFRALGFQPVKETAHYDQLENPGHIIYERKLFQ